MPLTVFRRKGSNGRPQGNWYIRGTVAGVRVYESARVDDKRAAEVIRARIENEIIQRAALGRSATLTFAEAALTYIEAGGEAKYLGPILQHFGPKMMLAKVDNKAVNRAAEALYPHAAPSTINRQLITPIGAVYNLAAEDHDIPPRRFRRRKEPQGRTRWLTPEEAERLLGHCDRHLLPIVAFLLGTGCRVAEALTLDTANLHLDTGQALIAETKNGEMKMVEIAERSRRMVAACGVPDAGMVFRTPKGLPYVVTGERGGQIEAGFRKACKAAGLGTDVTPHTLRHTFATWFYAETKDLVALMARGGWKKADMALRYTKLAPADLGERLRQYGWQMCAKSVQAETQVIEFGSKIKVVR